MKTISTLSDLRMYGIQLLTGEACAYGQRQLCDLSDAGATLVRTFLGLPADTVFHDNYNSRVGDAPAVASCMLTARTLWEIARFAPFHVDGADVLIVCPDGSLHAGHFGEPDIERYRGWIAALHEKNDYSYGLCLNFTKRSAQPRVGDRNIHAFSGRST